MLLPRNIIAYGVGTMTVYADVLLVINLFVNYALLACSVRIMKLQISQLRILLGAAAGSIYGLIIFLPELPKPAELVLRIAAAALIVFCTFGFGNIRRFLRCFFTFFSASLAFGGIMLVLWVTVAPVGMVYSNGAVYFDISLTVLAISTVVCFAVVSVISYFTARRAPKESVAQVTVGMNGETVRTNALIDTGNSLKESFSGFPAAVGEASVLRKILPQTVSVFLDTGEIGEDSNIRMIVHKTVSGTGIMPAFKPDFIEVRTLSGTVRSEKVYIAVTKNSLAAGEYGIILNPEIISEEKKYAETV